MQQILNKILWVAIVAGAMLCVPFKAHAQTGEPIIVLKSSIYETYGDENAFQVLLGGTEEGYIEVDCGFGPVEYKLVPATYDSSAGALTGTLINCTVTKEGTVKIYGDAEKIDVINASGCYLRSAEFPKLTNLDIIDLSHNELEGLDLTNFTKVSSIDVSDNPFSVSPLIVGGNKPDLKILDMGRIEKLDPSFNLSDYPSLITFDAWANKGLTRLDPTGCPNLQKISIDSTPVSSLDVSKNSQLQILNISDTGIGSIDLSNNLYLTQLYCDHMSGTTNTDTKMTSLDVTKNPNLVYLYANGNALTEIDLSQNRYLRDLFLNHNKLTTINLDNNPNLLQVQLCYNYFTFATLPLPGEWNTYDYIQHVMPVKKSYKEGDVLDLSDKVLRSGTTTTAAVYMTKEDQPGVIFPLGEEYYTYADGKITFLKAATDSVYVAFANSAFINSALASQPLCTNKFMVKSASDYGQNDKAFSFTTGLEGLKGTEVSFGVGISGATADSPKKFYVDFGSGRQVEYQTTTEDSPGTPNVLKGKTSTGIVTVYVPEGEIVTALDIEGVQLYNIDLSALGNLQVLRLVDTGLESIDLGWNRSLRKLEMTGNHFYSLNIRGVNDAYQKNLLHDINLSNNELAEVTLNDPFNFHYLNLSNNQLTELSFKDADMMRTLDVSGNKLTSIDVNYCTLMTSLNIADNDITSVTLPAETSLKDMRCENNALSFTTLPVLTGMDNYTYSPQQEIGIPKKGSGVDLSAHNLDGKTVYVWKKTSGETLAKGTDYTEDNGKFRFLAPAMGTPVYCELTNPQFSKLTMKTSVITPADMPDNVLATFTTTEDNTAALVLVAKEPNTQFMIDWKGDGVELTQYLVGTSPTNFTVNTHKGAAVKVYSYDDTDKLTVFSINGAKMKDVDFSKMTQLVNLTVVGGGLTELKMPESPELYEINLQDNSFSSIDLRKYPKLQFLSLNKNKFKTFDASWYPNLMVLALGDNELTSINIDNSKMWQLVLSGNKLADIDLSKVPDLQNLSLSHNEFSHIDVSPLKRLTVLNLDNNYFKFSTLPFDNGYALYTYTDQHAMDVPVVNGKVDLSSESVIDGIESEYRWFVGMPAYDDNGELYGEELYIDDEYTLENGVTTFNIDIDEVMCVMTNDNFPNMLLYTKMLDVNRSTTGIGSATADADGVTFSVKGNDVTVKAADGTVVRLYGIDGSLAYSTVVSGGEGVISGVRPGFYVIAAGGKTYKIRIRK